MSRILQRVEKAVAKDPSLRQVASRYAEMFREVSVDRHKPADSATQMGRKSGQAADQAKGVNPVVVASLLRQLAAASSSEEVREVQEKYRRLTHKG